MYFKEFSPAMNDYSLITETIRSETNLIKNDTRFLIVNLLPEHPYQYPLHQYIKESLTTDILGRIKKKFQIHEMEFVINKKKKYFFSHIIDDLNCKCLYKKPSYPYIFNLKNKLSTEKTQILNWFEFIKLSLEVNNKSITEIPVLITLFNSLNQVNEILMKNVEPGSKLSEITENINIEEENSIILNHPFKSNILTLNSKLTEIIPTTLLVYPKGLKSKAPIKKYFPVMFRNNSKNYKEYINTDNTYKDNPCQKCLRCSSICPVGLYPFMLSAIADRGSLKEAVKLNLERCIECGLCSYACPSDIPLMHNIIKLKKELKFV